MIPSEAALDLHVAIGRHAGDLIGNSYSIYYDGARIGPTLTASRIAELREIVNDIDAKLRAIEAIHESTTKKGTNP